MVEEKNVQEKRFILGQYFTRPEICDRIVRKIDFGDSIVIEPSFGTGNFIKALAPLVKGVIGIEVDGDIFSDNDFNEYGNVKIYNNNFYDFSYNSFSRIIFVGNPPFRTPAHSLSTHKLFISNLTKKI